MIIGLSVAAFTTLHVAISLIAIAAGLRVAADLLKGVQRGGPITFFLLTTILTSVTGFMFPAPPALSPAQIFGVISLAALALAVVALLLSRSGGAWRTVFIITSMFALYLNAFVAVVQAFQKITPLSRLAPTQSESPFLVAQLALLLAFIVVGWLAVRRLAPMRQGRIA